MYFCAKSFQNQCLFVCLFSRAPKSMILERITLTLVWVWISSPKVALINPANYCYFLRHDVELGGMKGGGKGHGAANQPLTLGSSGL